MFVTRSNLSFRLTSGLSLAGRIQRIHTDDPNNTVRRFPYMAGQVDTLPITFQEITRQNSFISEAGFRMALADQRHDMLAATQKERQHWLATTEKLNCQIKEDARLIVKFEVRAT